MTRRQLFAAVAGVPVAARAEEPTDDMLVRYLELFPDGPGGTRSEIDVSELDTECAVTTAPKPMK